MTRVKRARARQVFDSRGSPTVSVFLEAESGRRATVAAPSGASTGAHEVRAFPSGGVPEALERFSSTVAPKIESLGFDQLAPVDEALHALDGTHDFQRIGGNVATAVSVAASMLIASERSVELWEVWREMYGDSVRDAAPYPAIVGNCLNGGRHAIGGPDMQEFHAFAKDADPMRSVRAALAVHHEVGLLLQKRYPTLALGRGDEGGWVAPIGNIEAIELLTEACTRVRDASHVEVHPGLDLAASEFASEGRYRYHEQTLDAEGQIGFLSTLVDRYGLRYVEDPFDEEDYASFAAFTRAVGSKALVVGDDLFTTSVDRVRRGIDEHAVNAVLVKVNQVGTVSDTLATARLARQAGWTTVASHRSGDVPEGWLAHLSVGLHSAGIKCGLLGGERVAKLNELLRLAARVEG